MQLKENLRRHMYIKTSPMQDLMVIVPLKKVPLESFFCTHALKDIFRLKERKYAEGL